MSSLADLGLSETDWIVDELRGESPIRPWDLLYFGGEVWPGIWRIEVSKGLDFEVVKKSAKVPNLLTDPTITDKGYRPAVIKAIGQIWDAQSWQFLQELLPFIVPSQSTTPRDAYDISHPSLYLLGVQSVIVTNVRVPPPAGQILTIELDLLEWFPETAVLPATQKPLKPNSKPLKAESVPVAGIDPGDALIQ